MNVHLGSVFDEFVSDLLKTGYYQTQSEVLREGLRLLKEREDVKQLRLAELRKKSPWVASKPTGASSWTARKPSPKSGSVARSGNTAKDEAVCSHTPRRAGCQRHL